MKLIFTGDWHLRGNNPRNRIDDYPTTAVAKLREVFKIAVERDAKYILMPGDVWDRPEVSIAVLLDFAKILNESPVPIFVTPGNHDIYGYNLGSYNRSSLRLLEMLVPNLQVIRWKVPRLSYGDALQPTDGHRRIRLQPGNRYRQRHRKNTHGPRYAAGPQTAL